MDSQVVLGWIHRLFGAVVPVVVLACSATPTAAADPQDDYEFCTYLAHETGKDPNCTMVVAMAQLRCMHLADGANWQEMIDGDETLFGDRYLATALFSGAVTFYCPEQKPAFLSADE